MNNKYLIPKVNQYPGRQTLIDQKFIHFYVFFCDKINFKKRERDKTANFKYSQPLIFSNKCNFQS